jgi:hypothetical protein
MLKISRIVVATTLLALASSGAAEPLVTFGFREDAFRIDRLATFDGLQNGDIIVVHEEDGLAFSFGPGPAPQRLFIHLASGNGLIGPYLYGNGCSPEPFVAIRTADGALMSALSFTAGHSINSNVRWEIRRMGVTLGSGTTASQYAALMLVTDENGFDEVRVAADRFPFEENAWGDRNCLRLDNVLATVFSDSDGDGVFDRYDQCPDSEATSSVDLDGCTQQQFCSTVTIEHPWGLFACITADWGNDEQDERNPRDCRARRVANGWTCVER